MTFAELLPSDSFLEFAFLRWVLTPAARPSLAQHVVPQAELRVADHNYRLDYEIVGSTVRIAVELDGFAFHSDRGAFTYDRLRQNDLMGADRRILRFSYDSIRTETARCVGQLQAMLRQDPLLAGHLISQPVIETPEMDPDPTLGLPGSRPKVPDAHVVNYFDEVRARLRLGPLRRCQQEAFAALARYYRDGGKRAACVMSVGSGKTALGVAACLAFARKRALIVTPGSVILGAFGRGLDPSSPKNVLYALPGGALIPGIRPPRTLVLDRESEDFTKDAICDFSRDELLEQHLIVTNFQALGRIEDPDSLMSKLEPDDIDFLVIDEAHIAASASYQRLLDRFPHARALFMSACFRRLDGKPIDAEVVYRYRLVDSIADGNAKNIRFRRFEPDAEATEYEINWPDGRRDVIVGRDALAALLDDDRQMARITARSDAPIRQVVREVRRALDSQREALRPLKPRILFSALGELHAAQIARVATEEGIATAHVHHTMGPTQIAKILERFESKAGDLDALVHLKMLGQGYDFPRIAVVVPFRPYSSFGEFYQFVGRGIRFIHDPELSKRFGAGEQILDVVYHAELGLDGHVQDLYTENGLDPVAPEAANVDPTVDPNDAGGADLEGGRQPRLDARVVFQPGVVAAHMIHDSQRIAQLRSERELAALAQQYAEYASSSAKPVSFDQFVQIRKDLHA